jgi:homogentisate 1,2-dioxygenase
VHSYLDVVGEDGHMSPYQQLVDIDPTDIHEYETPINKEIKDIVTDISYQHQFVNCFPDQFQEWIRIRHSAHCVNVTLPDSNLRLAAVSHFHVHAQDLCKY